MCESKLFAKSLATAAKHPAGGTVKIVAYPMDTPTCCPVELESSLAESISELTKLSQSLLNTSEGVMPVVAGQYARLVLDSIEVFVKGSVL